MWMTAQGSVVKRKLHEHTYIYMHMYEQPMLTEVLSPCPALSYPILSDLHPRQENSAHPTPLGCSGGARLGSVGDSSSACPPACLECHANLPAYQTVPHAPACLHLPEKMPLTWRVLKGHQNTSLCRVPFSLRPPMALAAAMYWSSYPGCYS